MSLGHFLEVSFGARHLSVGARPLHAGYARYFGQGNNVACFLWERVGPVQVSGTLVCKQDYRGTDACVSYHSSIYALQSADQVLCRNYSCWSTSGTEGLRSC